MPVSNCVEVGSGIQLTKLHVENFKSLVNFDISFSKFSCLIGLNGSGKTTVLQFIDFLSQLSKGDTLDWLKTRQWSSSDLHSKLTSQRLIKFSATFLLDEIGQVIWEATFNPDLSRCTYERISIDKLILMLAEEKKLSLHKNVDNSVPPIQNYPIIFDYQGSVISQLGHDLLGNFHPALLKVKEFLLKTHSLELLSPAFLRRRSRNSEGGIGYGGEQMTAVLYGLGRSKRNEILAKLKTVYPYLQEIDVSQLQAGWKKLSVVEEYSSKKYSFESKHVNDGLLRLLAVFAQLKYDDGFVLFDEIENGINPELIEFVIDLLVESPHQVLASTHSPIVLNYIEDNVAIEGLIYIYKGQNGFTRSIPFFSIPSMNEKLSVMGPGDVYQDTSLVELQEEIISLGYLEPHQ
ncbi:AAA family ATPase [Cyanobium gracile UHCC 0139]|uniref:AAA family ATPase n=1 Tax=Cyanobium gracile UHCC 0139 TaxID=3110308 RepID=A0ABU5RY09_9CYAN|nr:AAA family ATPase [Cyanobium gracile]MEA5392665.1 AAA family ATPase [Cyanobium gracile UHCC 0139]